MTDQIRRYLLHFLTNGILSGFACASWLLIAGCGLFVNISPAAAQAPNITFERLLVKDGLAHSRVNAIIQDQRGFMWFATAAGLNRFDGYEFQIFSHNPENKNSLSDNFVHCLYEDKNGPIWIGTAGGLNRYDPALDKFTHYPLSHPIVRVIVPGADGRLWVGTEGGKGLHLFNPTSGLVESTPLTDAGDTNATYTVQALCLARHTSPQDSSAQILWIGTGNKGLFRYDPLNKTLERVPQQSSQLSDDRIIVLYQSQDNDVWIGTQEGGLNTYDPITNQISHLRPNKNVPASLSHNTVLSIFEDQTGAIWVGTRKGLNYFNRDTNEFHHYFAQSTDPTSLSNDGINAICMDRSGVFWIGTSNGGVNKFSPITLHFETYTHIPDEPNSLSQPIVRSICQDSRGLVWVGAIDGGLNRLDRQRKEITHFRHRPGDPTSLCDDDVTVIFEDTTHKLWIGTWNAGINRFDPVTGRFFAHYSSVAGDSTALSSNSIQLIYSDRNGQIWVGSEGGLDLFDPVNETFTHFLPQVKIQSNAILEDKNGIFWLGSWDGLWRFDPQSHQAWADQNLKNIHVLSIWADKNDHLWLGTFGSGLVRLTFDPSMVPPMLTQQKSLLESQGLPSNNIFGILPDDYGNLWLSTNNGLARYHLASNTIKTFGLDDGLLDKSFFWGAYYRSSEELFFGSEKGLHIFRPIELQENTSFPPIVITAFKLYDREMRFERTPPYLDEIELSYRENFFSFNFAALDYHQPGKNQYAYMLDGFDKDWVYCGARREAFYTKVDGGNYVFRVKGANNDGIWNKDGVSIRLIIHPPFWKTWWAYTIEFILLVSFSFGLHRSRTERIRRQMDDEIRRLEEERRQEEMGRARQIQMSMIPRQAPLIPALEVAAALEMAKHVGGDYYDFIQSGDKTKWYFVVADVSGKGVPASLLMVEARTALRSLAAMNLSPGEILIRLNEHIYADIQDNQHPMMITMLLLCWDVTRQIFQYAGAGHEYLIVYRHEPQTCELISAGGMWLGIEPNITPYIKEKELTIKENDFIFLYTDGVTETFNLSKEMFDLHRLLMFLTANRANPVLSLITNLRKDLDAFRNRANQHDDCTFMILKLKVNRESQAPQLTE